MSWHDSHDYWYHGQMALQIGVLVGFTQLIPEHQVQLFGVLRARVKVRISSRLSTRSRMLIRFDDVLVDFAHGLRDSIDCHVHHRLPESVDRYTVWLAGQLGMASVLQEEHGRHWWRPHVRR